MKLGHPVRDLKEPLRNATLGLVVFGCYLSLTVNLMPSALCVLAFVIACKTVCVLAIAGVSVRVDRALLLPSPG